MCCFCKQIDFYKIQIEDYILNSIVCSFVGQTREILVSLMNTYLSVKEKNKECLLNISENEGDDEIKV